MTEKTKVTLSLLLPQIPNAHDLCVLRLAELLKANSGILDAHLVASESDGDDQFCIHFDPQTMSVADARELAERAGAELSNRYGHLLIRSEPTHARRAEVLSLKLAKLNGVLEAVVAPDGTVRIEFDRTLTSAEELNVILVRLGIQSDASSLSPTKPTCQHDHGSESHHGHEDSHNQVVPHGHGHAGHGHAALLGLDVELVVAIAAGVFLTAGWLMSVFALPTSASLGMYAVAYLLGGWYLAIEATTALFTRRFEIDFLMLLAAIGAAFLGQWAEGALLLFLFSLGHSLEHYAMGRAKNAIEALGQLAPEFANVRRDGELVEVPVGALLIGDIVAVRPNERIAADGFVVTGKSSVNQAPLTGESQPVDKWPVTDREQAELDPEALDGSNRVFAGTINHEGYLEIQVTQVAAENSLSRVIKLVSEAETRTSPTQQFTNRFESYFVPCVLAATILLLFAWLVIDESFGDSFYRAMAVVVAASPCALAISTPSAVLSGIARAARGGVLFKGGAPLEGLGRVNAIAFDKTGTLTIGTPKLADIVLLNGISEQKLLQIVVSVETLSDHPLAKAIVRESRARLSDTTVLIASELKSFAGLGVSALVLGEVTHVGKLKLFSQIDGSRPDSELENLVRKLEDEGQTTVVVRHGDIYLGVIGLIDTPRESAQIVVAELRELGIQRVVMLSGDNQTVASAIARQVGIDEAFGGLMPVEKAEAIKSMRNSGGVAMVGDGVNDAPAMAYADAGIAMGGAGSHVALEAADIALMADDLSRLPFAVGLSRKANRIIKQNLWISLAMVAFLVPATVFGLRLGPAVILHEGSTLVVVLNSLRLLAYGRFNWLGPPHKRREARR